MSAKPYDGDPPGAMQNERRPRQARPPSSTTDDDNQLAGVTAVAVIWPSAPLLYSICTFSPT